MNKIGFGSFLLVKGTVADNDDLRLTIKEKTRQRYPGHYDQDVVCFFATETRYSEGGRVLDHPQDLLVATGLKDVQHLKNKISEIRPKYIKLAGRNLKPRFINFNGFIKDVIEAFKQQSKEYTPEQIKSGDFEV